MKRLHPPRFYRRCAVLPAGHWHCRHGHLEDCPTVMARSCPSVDEGPLAYAVMAGRMCWFFSSESLTQSMVRTLTEQGANVWCRSGLDADDVAALVAGLPNKTTVEDLR